MSSRLSFALAVILLLAAAVVRIADFTTLPSGLQQEEITDLRIAESIRRGRIEVFYNLGGEGRESLYHIALAAHISSVGSGTVSYRMFSLWMGMGTLALVYALAKRLFGPTAALAALALLAFNFLAIVESRTIGREVLVAGLVAAVLLILTIAFPIYQRQSSREGTTTAFTILGALLGFGFYIHPISLMIVLISMAFTAYVVLARHNLSRRRRNYTSFAILLMIIISMPYLISTLRQPGLAAANRLVGDYHGLLRSLGDGLAGFVIQGDMDPVHNLPGRPLIDLVSTVLAFIGLITALRYWRQPRFTLPLLATVGLLPITVLATNSPNFTAYIGILPLLALFFGLGVKTLINSLHVNMKWVGAVSLLLLVGFNIYWVTQDLFGKWPELATTQEAYNSRVGKLAHHLDLTASEIPSVVCAQNLGQRTPPAKLSGAQMIILMLNRRSAPIRYVDCRRGLVFSNGGEQEQIIIPEIDGLDKIHPHLKRWFRRGEMLTDPDLPPDSVLSLEVTDELANTIGRFMTTTPVSYAPEVAGDEKVVAPPVQFGGNLTFLGYQKEDVESYPPGGIITYITYWRVDGKLPRDLTLFTHVLSDPAAIPAAQTDIISVDANQMQNRDVFLQVTYVLLPLSMPEGSYLSSIGAYQETSDLRLDTFKDGNPYGNRLFLQPVHVEQNQ